MKKIITGIVVSDKMDKTMVVRAERKYRHPVYKKVVKQHKKYIAHCDIPDIKIGDIVEIQSTRPLSKLKHFIVISKKS